MSANVQNRNGFEAFDALPPRKQKALLMHMAGEDWTAIGEAVHRCVRTLQRWRDEPEWKAARVEIARDQFANLIPKVVTAAEEVLDTQGHGGRVSLITTMMATLLGLEAPSRHELTGKDGGPIEMRHEIGDILLRIRRARGVNDDGASGDETD